MSLEAITTTRFIPTDWPEPGPVDTMIHDPAHRSSTTEWWYVNGHFKTADGRHLSIFAAFFRIAHSVNEETKAIEYAHSLTWALSDADGKVYYADSLVDKRAPEIGLERIKQGRGSNDPRLNRAITEILEKGHVPAPDRMFKGDVFVDERRLMLDFDGAQLEKQDNGSYHLSLFHPGVHAGCNIVFHPEKPPVRHGDNGVLCGAQGEDMFYYFIPRCRLTGTVTLNGIEHPITPGTGWYDHEFGSGNTVMTPDGKELNRAAVPPKDNAWNWTAIQLDDGMDISAYSIYRADTQELIGQWLVVIDPEGHAEYYKDLIFEPVEQWRSKRTFLDYPVIWHLTSQEAGIDLIIEATFDDQEFITLIARHAFWEGRCNVRGAVRGKQTSGLAYIERSGFETIKNLDEFFSAVSEEVRKSVSRIIPFEPTYEQALDLIASKEREHYMKGVDIPQLVRTMARPIREIIDRGGKSWRSYAALVCCDVVGGDSRKYTQWLAMPELIHAGSLIVDDVEDKSTVRRGGPTCHLKYGEAIAINAGTAAYFMGQKLLISNGVSSARKLLLYDLYFEALRAGHAGQAIDIDGMGELMPEVVETGDSSMLELRILASQRLKTAVPAASLARMGALVGGGTREQVEAIGLFFEAGGLAFQIMDDVLNLRGFEGNLKVRGEDITSGKITFPIAKAMSRLSLKERQWLWETLQSQPEDPDIISSVVKMLEECGAIDACVEQARNIVENAWKNVEPVLPDSISKVMLRAFGWYVLERHY